MIKAINGWAFPKALPLDEAFQQAAAAGYEGFELTMDEEGPLTLDVTADRCASVAAAAAKAGVPLCSLASGLFWKYWFTSDDRSERERAHGVARAMLRAASDLGVDAILLIPGVCMPLSGDRPPIPYDVAYDRALEALRALAPVAEERGVHVGVENVWNGMLLSPLEMRDFIDAVGSPWVGAYFDVGNVVRSGLPEDWIRILGPRIKKVHFKDYRRWVGTLGGFVGLLEGDVNWPEVMTALSEVGYDGALVAEVFVTDHHPGAMVEKTSVAMDHILGRAG